MRLAGKKAAEEAGRSGVAGADEARLVATGSNGIGTEGEPENSDGLGAGNELGEG